MANIENRILEKKIAEKKKEELRQKNIAVIFPKTVSSSNVLSRCTETPRGHGGFISKIPMMMRRSCFQILNSAEVLRREG